MSKIDLSISPEQVIDGSKKIVSGSSDLRESLNQLTTELDSLISGGLAQSASLEGAINSSRELIEYLKVKADNMVNAGNVLNNVASSHQSYEENTSNVFRG